MSQMRGYKVINLLLVLAFLTAGVSPACQFISGKASSLSSYIEICTIYGIEKVAVAQDQSAGEERPGHDGHQMQDQCLFCVASHLNKAASAAFMATVFMPPVDAMAAGPVSLSRPDQYFARHYHARAPPYFS